MITKRFLFFFFSFCVSVALQRSSQSYIRSFLRTGFYRLFWMPEMCCANHDNCKETLKSHRFCIDLEHSTKLGHYVGRCVADPCFGPFCFCRCFLQSSVLGFTFVQNFTRHKCKILRVLFYFLFEQQFCITVTKCEWPSKNWMLF